MFAYIPKTACSGNKNETTSREEKVKTENPIIEMPKATTPLVIVTKK